ANITAGCDKIQLGQQEFTQRWIVLDHREMAYALHNNETRSRNGLGDFSSHIRCAGIVELTGEQRHFTEGCIDALDLFTRVPVDAVEMNVAGIHAWARLAVVPPIFAFARLTTLRRAQSVRVTRREFSTMNRRMVQILVVSSRRERRAFQS